MSAAHGHDVESERAILGAVLVDNAAWRGAAELGAADFYDPRNRAVFAAMAALVEDARPVDLITLKDALACTGDLEAAGGVVYLASLVDGLPRIPDVAPWCRIIQEHARGRRAAALWARGMHVARDGNDAAEQARLLEELRELTAPPFELRFESESQAGEPFASFLRLCAKPFEAGATASAVEAAEQAALEGRILAWLGEQPGAVTTKAAKGAIRGARGERVVEALDAMLGQGRVVRTEGRSERGRAAVLWSVPATEGGSP